MSDGLEDVPIALKDITSCWPALLPPSRIRVSEGARKLKIARPGGAATFWNPLETPYMVEPLDVLASRLYPAVCFVGPAQSGKTAALGEGWLTHAVLHDPGDMLIVQMTQDKAREYSKQRVDRAVRNSPELREMRSLIARDDNLHDKQFKNGMWVRIAWPTATNFSSTSYRYVFGTDYDRWPDNIDGEGDGFTLMRARPRTFLSRGKVVVESSPGRPIKDPMWRPSSPHEAPPVEGILGIYNRSDRRRWYWQCPHCAEFFEATPGLRLFGLPTDDELLADIRTLDIDAFARQYARVPCPVCASVISFDRRERMNQGGRWLADGLEIDSRGRVGGTPRVSDIAGFWLGGIAATYIPWEAMLRKHLQALLDYELTGSELTLQTTANTDQSVPYMSRLLEAASSRERKSMFDADLQRYVVPDWTRFVVAAVDVQGGKNARFVVQVHAIGEHEEQALVDRFAITRSKREGADGETAPLDPASYPEDWDLITERVVQATYRTGVEGQEVKVMLTLVDSGGEDGVTDKAYSWYRRVRRAGLAKKVRVTKGNGGKGSAARVDWYIKETMVGGRQGQGDVPMQLLEPNKFKDMVQAGLDRRSPGPGYYHFPQPIDPTTNPDGWLKPAFFDELKSEVRDANGVWRQVKKRNEAFDLCYMIRAGCMMLGTNRRNFWASPPSWALPLDRNSEVVTSELRRAEQAASESAAGGVAELPRRPLQDAQTSPRVAGERRVRRSAYLRG